MNNELLNNIAARAAEANKQQTGDYINPKTGLLHCGKCHAPKQCLTPLPRGGTQLNHIPCECKKKAQELENQRRETERLDDIRKSCFDDSNFTDATFDHDDGANKELMQVCRKYVEKFSLSSDWLLLHGGCGTGKSFAAACICNELIDKGFSVKFITISQAAKELFDAEKKMWYLNGLNIPDLLCIDDFGAERGTPYMQETVFELIDRRLKSGKPCVITTNLTAKELAAPQDLSVARVYSRVLEKALPFEAKGKDRRMEAFVANSKARLAALLAD